MNKYCHIIVNQHAGNGQGKKIALSLEKLLMDQNIPYLFHQTKYPGHAILLVEEIIPLMKRNSDRLWVIGGDGTLHEVINGIKKINSTVPIGYFPAGTGNDFARSIGLPTQVDEVFKNLLESTVPSSIEIIVYKDNHSNNEGVGLNSFGIGFDAEVTQIAKDNNSNKGWISAIKMDRLVYLWSIALAFKNRKTFQADIEVDGEWVHLSEILLVAVMNHPYFGGGIKIDPQSTSNNHQLAVMVIKNFSVPVLLKLLVKVLTDGSHIDSPYFERIPATEINIQTASPQLAQVDGEIINQTKHHLHFKLDTFFLWS